MCQIEMWDLNGVFVKVGPKMDYMDAQTMMEVYARHYYGKREKNRKQAALRYPDC